MIKYVFNFFTMISLSLLLDQNIFNSILSLLQAEGPQSVSRLRKRVQKLCGSYALIEFISKQNWPYCRPSQMNSHGCGLWLCEQFEFACSFVERVFRTLTTNDVSNHTFPLDNSFQGTVFGRMCVTICKLVRMKKN